MHAHTHRVGIM